MKLERLLNIAVIVIAYSQGLADAENSSVVCLGLKDVFEIARERQADIVMADERVQQALARVGQSNAGLLPQLHGSVAGARQTRDLRGQGIALPGDPHVGPFNSFDARIKMTQTLLDPSAIARLNQARQGKQLSIAEARKIKEDVLALAATLYINARQSAEELKAQHADMAYAYNNYLSMKAAYEQGTISNIDWLKANGQLTASYYQWRQVKTQANKDRLDLCAILDLPMDAMIDYVSDDIAVDVSKVDAKSLEGHPDVELASRRVTLNMAQQRFERSERLPQVKAMADYGRTGEDFDGSSNTYTIGLQVSVPFWEGGLRGEKIKEAESKVRESRLGLEQVKRESMARLLESAETIEQARAFRIQADMQLRITEQQLKVAVQKFKNGTGSLLDVYQNWSLKLNGISRQKDAYAAYQLAQINVAHAMGLLQDVVQHQQEQETP